jgi:AcrR family transcriptional regulator
MAATTVATREKLLEAATRLFAERGAFDVSLAEVVREAGQRNASAVHYHFGSREHVLVAILEPMVHDLRARRRELLAQAAATPSDDVRSVVEIIVRPLVEQARRGWRERAAMKIGMELGDRPDRTPRHINRLLARAGGTEALALLAERCPPLPRAIWTLRTNLVIGMVSRAATDRARLLDERPPPRQAVLDDERFVQSLIDVVIGALTAPSTAVVERPPIMDLH